MVVSYTFPTDFNFSSPNIRKFFVQNLFLQVLLLVNFIRYLLKSLPAENSDPKVHVQVKVSYHNIIL